MAGGALSTPVYETRDDEMSLAIFSTKNGALSFPSLTDEPVELGKKQRTKKRTTMYGSAIRRAKIA